MSARFPKPLEWQRKLFEQIDEAIAAGEQTFMCTVGRQAGKTAGLLLWALTWARGVLAGGSVAICAPSGRHYDEVKAQAKRWLADIISGPSTGDGWDTTTGGRLDFWSLGAGAVAPLRGRDAAFDVISLERDRIDRKQIDFILAVTLDVGDCGPAQDVADVTFDDLLGRFHIALPCT